MAECTFEYACNLAGNVYLEWVDGGDLVVCVCDGCVAFMGVMEEAWLFKSKLWSTVDGAMCYRYRYLWCLGRRRR